MTLLSSFAILATLTTIGKGEIDCNENNITHFTCFKLACVNDGMFGSCEPIDISEWYSKTPYTNCSSTPPYDISEASSTRRKRRNVEHLNQTELITLMKAVSCAYMLPSNPENYQYNSFFYTLTFHGEPNWFSECNNTKNGGHNFGQESTGCCTHMKPNFFTWHRLLVMAMENSLRMWDLDIGLPYMEWTDYQPNTFPELISNISFFDYDGKEYRNPFYNYKVPEDIRARNECATCVYSYLEGTDDFWNSTKPDFTYSFFKQIYHSYFYSNWLAFDYMNEVPHNNVHDLLSGNMPQTPISTYAPIFMLHHSAVEKYFLIWQRIMNETFNIDYTDRNVQDANFGCFTRKLKMNQYLGPFSTNMTTSSIDPIVTNPLYNEDGFAPLYWQDMNYEYDEYNVGPLSWVEVNKDLCKFFDKDGTKYPKCLDYLDYFNTSETDMYGYDGTQFIAWYLRVNNMGLRISYSIYDYADQDSGPIFSSKFATVGGSDAWEENSDGKAGQYLYRIDITDELYAAGLSIQDDTLFVEYNISVKFGGIWYNCQYGDVDCEFYDYIDYPIFIYKQENQTGYEAAETFQIHLGLSNTHIYRNSSIIFHPFATVADRNSNTSIHLKFFNDQSDSDSSSSTLVTFSQFFANIEINNDIFSTNTDEDYNTFFTSTYASNTTTITLVALNQDVYLFDLFLSYINDESEISYTTNEWSVLDWNSQNYLSFAESSIIHYSDLHSWQGFDSSIFTSVNNSDRSLNSFVQSTSNIPLPGSIEQVTDIRMPWADYFVHEDSTVYGNNHILTGWHPGGSITFPCCKESPEQCSRACYTNDYQIYNTCDIDSIDTKFCGHSFGCSVSGNSAIAPNFTTGEEYYIISQNYTECKNGLKFGLTFEYVDPKCGPVPNNCSKIPDGLRTSIINENNNNDFSIITNDNCITNYTLKGPKEDGWFAYAWYGTYTNDTSKKSMTGYAIVVQYCDIAVDDMNFRVSEQILYRQGYHDELSDITENCNYTTDMNDETIMIVNCNITRSDQHLIDVLGYKNFKIMEEVEYNYLKGEYTIGAGKMCDFDFGSSQRHENTPSLLQYKFCRYDDEECLGLVNIDIESTNMVSTTKSREDGACGLMVWKWIKIGVVILAASVFW